MSADLMPFTYEGAQFRTVVADGEPGFIANDVCAILDIRNSRDALGRLDDDEKGVVTTDTLGGPQQMAYVTEAGFYALVFTSRKAEAREFKRWVTHEVLPAIRKTGGYSATAIVPADYPAALEEAARQARLVIEERAARQVAEYRVAELAPKADAFDAFLNGEGLYHVGTVARMIGVGQNIMFRFLYEQHVLISSGPRRKQPYANPKFDGWFGLKPHDQSRTNGHAVATTMVTPRGAEGIRLLAIQKGLIEPALIVLPYPKEISA